MVVLTGRTQDMKEFIAADLIFCVLKPFQLLFFLAQQILLFEQYDFLCLLLIILKKQQTMNNIDIKYLV